MPALWPSSLTRVLASSKAVLGSFGTVGFLAKVALASGVLPWAR